MVSRDAAQRPQHALSANWPFDARQRWTFESQL